MNVIVIGTGFVGATHAAVLASVGHTVIAYDLNKERVSDLSSKNASRIDSAIYEPGLANLIIESKTLTFTSNFLDIAPLLDTSPIVFLCLPTPAHELTLPDEKKFLFIAATQLSQLLKKRNEGKQTQHSLLVTKSTVPIGTATRLKEYLEQLGVTNFTVASNPEFLVEGKAVEGSQKPDRIVIGVENEEDEKTLRAIYHKSDVSKIIVMQPQDAEAVKLIANFELFSTVVRTYQVLGRLCEVTEELNFENIVRGVTTDPRIPKWGHYNSLYAGGSCFEKDAFNLLHTFNQHDGAEQSKQFVQGIIDGNNAQLERFYNRAKEPYSLDKRKVTFDFKGKTVALLGTAFKQDTNDVRMSPAITLAKWLIRDGVKSIRTFDPQANENFKKTVNDERVVPCATAKEALKGTDACIICTDWPEFKSLGNTIANIGKHEYLIMDGRRSLTEHYFTFMGMGMRVIAVGSPTIGPHLVFPCAK